MTVEELLIQDEGLALRAYRCRAGKISIGVGRNLEDHGISREEALHLLGNDIKAAEQFIRVHVPVYRELGDVRKAVLVSMYHVLGPDGFLGFKETLWMVGKFMFDRAAHNLLQSKWQHQLQRWAPGKETRVDRLAEMMRTGRWPGEQ